MILAAVIDSYLVPLPLRGVRAGTRRRILIGLPDPGQGASGRTDDRNSGAPGRRGPHTAHMQLALLS